MPFKLSVKKDFLYSKMGVFSLILIIVRKEVTVLRDFVAIEYQRTFFTKNKNRVSNGMKMDGQWKLR